MKKSLIALVVLAIFCFASIASAAANPFSDVPAKHWAYAAVNQLQKAGIVEGYGDGTFRGDKAMTRYEMATIVANAMTKSDKADAANKALIDKLATEFAAELKSLGARVTKLEEKTKFTLSGDARVRYMDNKPGYSGNIGLQGADKFDERYRIMFKNNFNDNASATFRMGYQNKPGTNDSPSGDWGVYSDTAQLTFKDVFGAIDKVRVGRDAFDVIGYGLLFKPGDVDGITVYQKFGNVQFTAFTGNVSDLTVTDAATGTSIRQSKQITTAQLGFPVSDNFNLGVGYYWADIPGTVTSTGNGSVFIYSATSNNVFKSSKGLDVSFDTKLGDWKVLGEWVKTSLVGVTSGYNLPANPKGWFVQATNGVGYKLLFDIVRQVNEKKPGTDAWIFNYHSNDAGNIPAGLGGYDVLIHSYSSGQAYGGHFTDNDKGYQIAYQNVIALNTVLSLEYNDNKVKNLGQLTGANPVWNSDQYNKSYRVHVEVYF